MSWTFPSLADLTALTSSAPSSSTFTFPSLSSILTSSQYAALLASGNTPPQFVMDALNFTGGFPSSSDFWPSLAMLAGYTATMPLLFYRIADRRSRTWFLVRPALFLAMRVVTLSMRVYMSKASYSVQVLGNNRNDRKPSSDTFPVSELTFVSLGLLLLAESLVALWSRSVDLSSLGLATNTHKWTRVLTYLLRFLLVAACAMGISATSELPLSFDNSGNVGRSVYILRVGSYAVSAAIILSLFVAILSSHFTLHVPLLRTTYLLAINFLLACVAGYRVAQTFSINADDAIRRPVWFWTFQMLVEFLAYLLFLLISIPEAFPSSSQIKSIASRSSISVSSIEHEKRVAGLTTGSGHVDRLGRVVRFLPFKFPSVSSTSDHAGTGNGNGNGIGTNGSVPGATGILSATVQTHGPGRFTPAPTIGPLQRIWKRKASRLLRLKREEAINEAKAAQAREMGEDGIPRDSHEHDADAGEEDITAHSSRALHGAGGAYDPNDLRAIGSPVFVHDDDYDAHDAHIPEGIDPYAASARLGQAIHTSHASHTGHTGHGFNSSSHHHSRSITIPNFSRPGVTGLGVGVTSADATPLEEKRAMDMDVIRSMVLEASIPTPTLSFADLPSASLPHSPSGGDFTPSHPSHSHSHSKSMSRVISHDSEKRFAREAADEQALSPRSKPPSLHFSSHHDDVDQGDYATVDPRTLGERLNVWADVERGRSTQGEGEYEYESAYGYRRPSGAGSLNRMRTLSF
ncbi:hypothetical protein JCM24511_05450 [Saitozyma sp. JCM 24511]|nr:hypothetical protein JCM24511_05450 [Saitozyma sp. JCM 24511]